MSNRGGGAMSENGCGAASKRSAGHRRPVVKKTAQATLYMLRLQRPDEVHTNSYCVATTEQTAACPSVANLAPARAVTVAVIVAAPKNCF